MGIPESSILYSSIRSTVNLYERAFGSRGRNIAGTEIIADAIPDGDLPKRLCRSRGHAAGWECVRQPRFGEMGSGSCKLGIGADLRAWPGLRSLYELNPGRPVLTLNEFTAPDYVRSAIYNELALLFRCGFMTDNEQDCIRSAQSVADAAVLA